MSRTIQLFALSAAAVAASAGLAGAQAIDFGGLHHEPVGGAVLTPAPDGSLMVEHLGGVSSGVEVLWQTTSGMETSCDLSEFFRSPGSAMRWRHKGWDGTVKGRVEMRCGTPGVSDTTFDFSTLRDATGAGVRQLHWVVRDLIGNEIASGNLDGATKSFSIIPPPMSPVGVTEPSQWNVRQRINELEGVLKNFGLIAQCSTTHFRVVGLSSAPIEHAASVEFFPIMCITSPCPGAWNDISSMVVTASGLPSQSFRMYTPQVIQWRSHGGYCGITDHFRSIPVLGLGACSLSEACDMPPPIACAPDEMLLRINNIGSSGQDGVEIRFDRAETYRNGIVHRDIAAFAGEARVVATELPGAIGQVSAQWQAPIGDGHVTVLKLSSSGGGAAGGAMIFADAEGQGSSMCVVECVDASGTVLASTECDASQGILTLQPLGGEMIFHSSCDALGVGRVRCPAGECFFPDGTRVSGVDSLVFRPVAPALHAQAISRCVITASDVAFAVVDSLDYTEAVLAGGLSCVPLDGSCVSAADGGIAISPPAGATTFGASVVTNSAADGALSVDVGQLLNTGGEIKIRHKGWDGLIYHRLTLSSPPGSNQITEETDFSGLGVSGFDWTLRGQDGGVLAEGSSPGETISWSFAAADGAASLDKYFAVAGAASARSANEGFFDRAVNVTGLGSVPVDGVYSIELDPIECFGCPPVLGDSSVMEISGGAIAGIVIGSVVASVSNTVHWNGHQFEANARGIGAARIGINEPMPETRLHVTNIGSSGQDGVEVRFFETGKVPVQEDFWDIIDSMTSSGWGGGGAGGSFVSHEFSAACPSCLDGHVTVLKLTETRDNGMSWFACDYSAVSPSGFELQVFDAAGTLIDSLISLNDDRFAMQRCDSPVSVACDSSGAFTFTPCSSVCVLPNGNSYSNVARIVGRPLSATVNLSPDRLRVTGRSVRSMTLSSIEVRSCPGDFNHDGGVDGDDVILFFGFWDAGDSAADFNGDGGVDGDDVIQFFERWDAGC